MVTVDFRVTGTCHMRCDFCHGAERGTPEAATGDLLDVMSRVREAGVQRINVSGGDPLTRGDIVKILAHAKDLAMFVYVSTDGVRLLKLHEQIDGLVDWIGVPLDGSTPEMNVRMSRIPKTHEITTGILRRFHARPPSHQVKVGTVVSRINIENLPAIGRVLFETPGLRPPDVWRLYEFAPRGVGALNASRHVPGAEEYRAAVEAVSEMFGAHRVSGLSNDDHDDSYFFVEPDLRLVTASGPIFRLLGDAMTLRVDELRDMFFGSKHQTIALKSNKNRSWLD
jgi:MoaA/NifB/PqqE/SkfB family radical SAM enzyme